MPTSADNPPCLPTPVREGSTKHLTELAMVGSLGAGHREHLAPAIATTRCLRCVHAPIPRSRSFDTNDWDPRILCS
jgi:hypothetical protein